MIEYRRIKIALIETKELLNFRKFLNETGNDFILNLMERRIDEVDYESWEEYAKAYQNFFSKFGKTTVTETNERNKRRNKYQFIITVQLNDFQRYEIVVRKSYFDKQAFQKKVA